MKLPREMFSNFLLTIPHFLALCTEVLFGWIFLKYCSEQMFGDLFFSCNPEIVVFLFWKLLVFSVQIASFLAIKVLS